MSIVYCPLCQEKIPIGVTMWLHFHRMHDIVGLESEFCTHTEAFAQGRKCPVCEDMLKCGDCVDGIVLSGKRWGYRLMEHILQVPDPVEHMVVLALMRPT